MMAVARWMVPYRSFVDFRQEYELPETPLSTNPTQSLSAAVSCVAKQRTKARSRILWMQMQDKSQVGQATRRPKWVDWRGGGGCY